MNHPKLVLKSGRERSILNFHPWIFSGAVKELPKAQEGDIIEVHNNHHQIVGYGFYSQKSQITCRLFEFGNNDLVADEAYWYQKIKSAYDIRVKYLLTPENNTFRLIHAEGDFFPGLIVDIYHEVAVVQLLIKGTEKIYPMIVSALKKLGYSYIYLKMKENASFLEGIDLAKQWLTDPYTEDLYVMENGIRFQIDVVKGQKTGFFIDQRQNRALVGSYSKGRKVLNAFSYTGGFSAYALLGGASLVHSVDISKDANALCNKNIQMNSKEAPNHESFTADCFEYLRQSPENTYDLIVLDPPAFAKNARSVPNASRGYKDLNLLAFKKIQSGGLVFTFSCSGNIDKTLFRQIVFGAAADSGRKIRILHQLTQGIDHPINIYHPEGEYLKGLVLEVE